MWFDGVAAIGLVPTTVVVCCFPFFCGAVVWWSSFYRFGAHRGLFCAVLLRCSVAWWSSLLRYAHQIFWVLVQVGLQFSKMCGVDGLVGVEGSRAITYHVETC